MNAGVIAQSLLEGEESAKDFLRRTVQRRKLEIGSVSSGTMRSEDLIDAFMYALGRVDKAAWRKEHNDREYQDWLLWRRNRDVGEDNQNQLYLNWEHEYAWYLIDLLHSYCPPFTYFGAHEGDGSDYGCWIDNEALEQRIDEGRIAVWDLPSEDGEGETILRSLNQGHWPDIGDFDYILFHRTDNGSQALWDAKTRRKVWGFA